MQPNFSVQEGALEGEPGRIVAKPTRLRKIPAKIH